MAVGKLNINPSRINLAGVATKTNYDSRTLRTPSDLASVYETERQQKYGEGLTSLQKVLELFGPDYNKGVEQTALANMNADLISRGLGSTTLPTAMSAGIKTQTEDIRRSRLADALANIAQYIQQSAPTPALTSSLTEQGIKSVVPTGPSRYAPKGAFASHYINYGR